ncbi:beta-N-acetylhexosaminidase [uncultured Sunxiuqinia sp.]|uniref:beta-N-acetylhexosaminidase n=1 Tax=uncultured Sunxiuqinia sp. TaxID=1573825 RepID=UPI002AA6A0C2|nr:beta-N-acetylhexosaminidase [uncultured Sunxiuqinia sp.]
MSKTILITLSLLIAFVGAKQEPATDLSKHNLIPRPVAISATGNTFHLNGNTSIYVSDILPELTRSANYLREKLQVATGYEFKIIPTKEAPSAGIYLTTVNDGELGSEGYELLIETKLLTLKANDAGGIFRGIQTIRQLLPAAIEKPSVQKIAWSIPTGTIRDFPEYEYRGTMLDVARHFLDVEDVKHYLDLMAYYKFNAMHLHLSDDQGWRIEIKSWPKLTEIGGSTEVGGGKGGFFTQEQYADIVNYAADRYITIIPEIDMPGHTNAALASYPELNCDGQATDLYTGTKVGFSTLCTNKEITYKFIDDVISELAELTPGPYFHIGGDESHVTKKEDYISFIERVQDIVYKHNKTMIGWDEITLSRLDKRSIAQYWASAENAKNAVEQGVKVIMSPARKAYLDMQYDSISTLGLHWAGYIEVDTGYNWDPTNLEKEIGREHILGIEAPLWTETVTNRADMEYLVFPRLAGYAEIGWSPTDGKSWNEYKHRLASHGKQYDTWGINYYRSKLVPWSKE